MKKILLCILCLILASCASITTRLENYKKENRNITEIKVNGTVEQVKSVVRQAAKEMGLTERPELEKENFIFVNIGYGDYLKSAFSNILLSGSYTRMGVFLDYDRASNITAVAISEEVAAGSKKYRYDLADKIRLLSLK